MPLEPTEGRDVKDWERDRPCGACGSRDVKRVEVCMGMWMTVLCNNPDCPAMIASLQFPVLKGGKP